MTSLLREVKSALIRNGSLNYAITCTPDRPQLTIRITTFDDDYAQSCTPLFPCSSVIVA